MIAEERRRSVPSTCVQHWRRPGASMADHVAQNLTPCELGLNPAEEALCHVSVVCHVNMRAIQKDSI